MEIKVLFSQAIVFQVIRWCRKEEEKALLLFVGLDVHANHFVTKSIIERICSSPQSPLYPRGLLLGSTHALIWTTLRIWCPARCHVHQQRNWGSKNQLLAILPALALVFGTMGIKERDSSQNVRATYSDG